MATEEKAKKHLGGKKKSEHKGKKHVHKMHIRHAANGGHIVDHEFAPEEGENGEMSQAENEEHILPPSEGNQMLAQHVAEHMAPPQEAPAAPPAAPPQAPPQGM